MARPLLQPDEMSTFRTLAREIHRRSVWQVLGVYLFASWMALQVVDVLTNNYGLPDWVPGFALVLLIIGLPIVLATAIVQEGAPGRETWTGTAGDGTDERSLMEGEPHPLAAGEPHPLAPEEPHPVTGSPGAEGGAGPAGSPARDAGLIHRLFTWRNAILGGVAAFALLGFAVAVYFTMWATGVGPVGSLVAQGVLEERDRVVLADFGNATDDPGLGDVVTEALRVDLVQSPILTVADPSFVDRVLRRMGREPSAELTPELAREVAIREGLKAVIQGEIAPAGEGSLLTASIVSAADGTVLAAFRETVDADGDVIAAIDGLSRQIREKAGESLPRIRAGEALTTVTTSSLDALRLYSEAMRLTERGRPEEALGLLEEAVQMDTAFAMAWRKISALRSNAAAPHLETAAAAARAYAHRDRLTERERYLATAFYNDVATGDLEAANRAYRSVLRLDPDDGTALNNLALNLLDVGRVDEARELLERAVDGPGESNVAHVNMMRAYLQSGDPASARRALERARERYPGSRWTNAWFAFLVAHHAGEDGAALEAARRVEVIEDAPVSLRAAGTLAEGFLHLGAGRLAPALDRLDAATALAEREGRADLGLQMGQAASGASWTTPPSPPRSSSGETRPGPSNPSSPRTVPGESSSALWQRREGPGRPQPSSTAGRRSFPRRSGRPDTPGRGGRPRPGSTAPGGAGRRRWSRTGRPALSGAAGCATAWRSQRCWPA